MVRRQIPFSVLPREVLKAALAAWWEFPDFNAKRLGEDVGRCLEKEVFAGDPEIADFLSSVIEPRIRAGQEHVTGLYQLARDERYQRVAGALALRWLKGYPDAKATVQRELVHAVLRCGPIDELRILGRERAATLASKQNPLRAMWMGRFS